MQAESKSKQRRIFSRAHKFFTLFETDREGFRKEWDALLTSAVIDLRRMESRPEITTQSTLNRIESALARCPAALRQELFEEARSILLVAQLQKLVSAHYRQIHDDWFQRLREMARIIRQDPNGEEKVRSLLRPSPEDPSRPEIDLTQAVEIVHFLTTEASATLLADFQ